MNVFQRMNRGLFRLTGCRLTREPVLMVKGNDLQRILKSELRFERWGVWSDTTLSKYTSLVREVDGDFAEIGVAKGDTFHRLARIAHQQGKMAHAFDSFVGMASPGRHDRQADERGAHVEGKFSVGGADGFSALMDGKGISRAWYKLWPGFIPSSFDTTPDSLTF